MKATDLERLTEVILARWHRVEFTVPELPTADNFTRGENKMGLSYVY